MQSLTKAPYDLTPCEQADANAGAASFASALPPWRIQRGHGTYVQIRDGLGITVLSYDVTVDESGVHHWSICYAVSAWSAATSVLN